MEKSKEIKIESIFLASKPPIVLAMHSRAGISLKLIRLMVRLLGLGKIRLGHQAYFFR
jgi:hypothetical protein